MRKNSKLLLKILSGTFLVGLITSCGCQRTADDSSSKDSSVDNSSEVVSSQEDVSSNESQEESSEQSLLPTSIEDAFARGLAGYKSTVYGKDHDLSYTLSFGMPEYFLTMSESKYTYNHETKEFNFIDYGYGGGELSYGEQEKYYMQNDKGIYLYHEYDEDEGDIFHHLEVNDVVDAYYEVTDFPTGTYMLAQSNTYFMPLFELDTFDEVSSIISKMASAFDSTGYYPEIEMSVSYAVSEDNATYDLMFNFSYSNEEIGTNASDLVVTFDAQSNVYISSRMDMTFYAGTENENVISTIIEVSEEFDEEFFNASLTESAIPEVEEPDPDYVFHYVRHSESQKHSGFNVGSLDNENPNLSMNDVIALLNSTFEGGYECKYYTSDTLSEESYLAPSDTPLTETEIHDLAIKLAKSVYAVPTDVGNASFGLVSVIFNYDHVSEAAKKASQRLFQESHYYDRTFGTTTGLVVPNTFMRSEVNVLDCAIDFEWRVNGELVDEMFAGEPGASYDMTVTYNLTDEDIMLALTDKLGE